MRVVGRGMRGTFTTGTAAFPAQLHPMRSGDEPEHKPGTAACRSLYTRSS